MSNKRKIRQQEAARRKKRRNYFLPAAAVLAVVFVAFYVARLPADINPGDGVLATPVAIHDFGTVSLSRGTVSTELPLLNVGEEDLIITFLDSSCGCTTARVINENKVGPVFGMSSHGKSPRNWHTAIKPGDQAKLKISYDPSVHPKFRGPATRVVTITTNSKSTPTRQVRIEVMQTD